MIGLPEIQEAEKRIRPYILKTPLVRAENLDEILGCQVYLKCELMQRTNSFKLRGAMNRMLNLTEEEKKRGVVTSSSGNHGKAMSYAAKLLGIKATVVVPDTSPQVKIDAIAALGADIVPSTNETRFQLCADLSKKHGYVLVHPYDDELIMAGQGTMVLEIMEDLPDFDRIVVPVGGGGLISGVSTAVKALRPQTEVVGVEIAAVPRYTESLKAGEPVSLPAARSKADALLALRPGNLTFPVVKERVDRILRIQEKYIALGNKLCIDVAKVFCEPSSGVGLGIALQGEFGAKPTDKVVFIITGGGTTPENIAELWKTI